MNDFTKEELGALLEYLDYPVMEIEGTQGLRLSMAKKLQSMIDGYCEHEHGAYVAKVSHPVDVHIWNQPANIVECP